MTLFAGSPCAKIVSFAAYLPTVLPRPVESRNNFASNALLPKCAFLGERRAWADTRRAELDTMRQNTIERSSACCSILHSTTSPAQPPRAILKLEQVLWIEWVTVDC